MTTSWLGYNEHTVAAAVSQLDACMHAHSVLLFQEVCGWAEVCCAISHFDLDSNTCTFPIKTWEYYPNAYVANSCETAALFASNFYCIDGVTHLYRRCAGIQSIPDRIDQHKPFQASIELQ